MVAYSPVRSHRAWGAIGNTPQEIYKKARSSILHEEEEVDFTPYKHIKLMDDKRTNVIELKEELMIDGASPTRSYRSRSPFTRDRQRSLPYDYNEHLLSSVEAKASARIMRDRRAGIQEMMDIVKNYSRQTDDSRAELAETLSYMRQRSQLIR